MSKSERILCIVWAPSSSRMDDISSVLGARKYYLAFRYGPRYFAPLRYVVLCIWTYLILLANRPDVVYAQNPPIFCPLTCLLYGSVFHKKILIDHHAVWSIKTFGSSPLKRPVLFLEKFASRVAFANTTPHFEWSLQFEKMGAKRVTTLFDFVEENHQSPSVAVREKYLGSRNGYIGIAPHGGHELERIENEIDAARGIPEFALLISGPPQKLANRLKNARTQDNVRYIGFVSFSEYSKILSSMDLGINISDEPYTISHCLLEFAARSIPAISTRQKVVEELFGESIYYTKSSNVDDIREAIKSMIGSTALMKEYRDRIHQKQLELSEKHEVAIAALKKLISKTRS